MTDITVQRPAWKNTVEGQELICFENNTATLRRLPDGTNLQAEARFTPVDTLKGGPVGFLAAIADQFTGLTDATAEFQEKEVQEDTWVTFLVVRGWKPADTATVAAFMKIEKQEKEQAARLKKAKKLEAEARKLRR